MIPFQAGMSLTPFAESNSRLMKSSSILAGARRSKSEGRFRWRSCQLHNCTTFLNMLLLNLNLNLARCRFSPSPEKGAPLKSALSIFKASQQWPKTRWNPCPNESQGGSKTIGLLGSGQTKFWWIIVSIKVLLLAEYQPFGIFGDAGTGIIASALAYLPAAVPLEITRVTRSLASFWLQLNWIDLLDQPFAQGFRSWPGVTTQLQRQITHNSFQHMFHINGPQT